MRAVYIYKARQEMRAVYAARQGMRACNNNNMHNPPYISFIMGLGMLLLLHALIPCRAAYILPSSILPSSSVLLHLYCTCFSTFWHYHPYIHFNGNVLLPLLNENVVRLVIIMKHTCQVQTVLFLERTLLSVK